MGWFTTWMVERALTRVMVSKMIRSNRNKELYLSCEMFQMTSPAFPPERDIWGVFGWKATVMTASGKGEGTVRIPLSLRSGAISLSFAYFSLSFCCSLSVSLLFFYITVQLSSCSCLAAHQWAKSQHLISLCSVRGLVFLSLIYLYIYLPVFEDIVKSNHTSWFKRPPEKIFHMWKLVK